MESIIKITLLLSVLINPQPCYANDCIYYWIGNVEYEYCGELDSDCGWIDTPIGWKYICVPDAPPSESGNESPEAIPTLSEWGMIIFFVLLILSGFWVNKRRGVH